jgi:hypothetical protein
MEEPSIVTDEDGAVWTIRLNPTALSKCPSILLVPAASRPL